MTEGPVTVSVAVDHCTAEGVGIHVAKFGNRFEALEPIRQAVRDRFGSYGPGVAEGLKLRRDHGSHYMSDDFQKELTFLGIEPSPPFVPASDGDACPERFIPALKEQIPWVQAFDTVEELTLLFTRGSTSTTSGG